MPDLLNPKLTASWEKGLDLVAKKQINQEEFMEKLENYIKNKINKLVIKFQQKRCTNLKNMIYNKY